MSIFDPGGHIRGVGSRNGDAHRAPETVVLTLTGASDTLSERLTARKLPF